jgi:hypothetical protein
VASSHEGEYSYTGPTYSVFTGCLLEALQGKASVNKDGFARILDVLIYLYEHVPKRANGPQHPFLNRVEDMSDNFALCYYAGGEKTVIGEPTSALRSVVEAVTQRFPTPGERLRLEKQRNNLQQEWDLLETKVNLIRKELHIETQIESRFRMEQHLLQDEAAQSQIQLKLESIEKRLK